MRRQIDPNRLLEVGYAKRILAGDFQNGSLEGAQDRPRGRSHLWSVVFSGLGGGSIHRSDSEWISHSHGPTGADDRIHLMRNLLLLCSHRQNLTPPLFLLPVFLFGCGSAPVRTLPTEYQTVFIDFANNKTLEYGAEERLTEAFVREFQRDGNLRQVGEWRQADLALEVSITRYDLDPVTLDNDNRAAGRNLVVTVEAQARSPSNRGNGDAEEGVFLIGDLFPLECPRRPSGGRRLSTNRRVDHRRSHRGMGMTDALAFLSKLKSTEVPSVIHLMGEDQWIREIVRKRIVETWCGEGEVSFDRVVGTQGVGDLSNHFGSASLFATKNVIALSDPAPGEKGTALSSLGKNQLATLEKACASIPKQTDLLVIETATLKKSSVVFKTLSKLAFEVDVAPPKGAVRKKWIEIMAKRTEVRLSPPLLDAMNASEVPLGTLLADMNKLSLATEPEEEASIELWNELTQSSPEVSVWEIGDFLNQGQTAKVVETLRNLRTEGRTIHELLPALFNWSQQRLQIRSHQLHGGADDPEGIHPFVLKKIGSRIGGVSIERIRKETRELYRLDRVSKQSLEDPELALEKSLVSFTERKI